MCVCVCIYIYVHTGDETCSLGLTHHGSSGCDRGKDNRHVAKARVQCASAHTHKDNNKTKKHLIIEDRQVAAPVVSTIKHFEEEKKRKTKKHLVIEDKQVAAPVVSTIHHLAFGHES